MQVALPELSLNSLPAGEEFRHLRITLIATKKWIKIMPVKKSVQIVWHSDAIPERFLKKLILNNKKHVNYPACNELNSSTFKFERNSPKRETSLKPKAFIPIWNPAFVHGSPLTRLNAMCLRMGSCEQRDIMSKFDKMVRQLAHINRQLAQSYDHRTWVYD